MTEKMMLGDKEVEFKASAATPIIYKKIFGNDLLVDLSQTTKLEDKTEQGSRMSDIVHGLAYVMYCEANLQASVLFTKLNYQSFIEWLMTIESGVITEKSAEFIKLYQANQKNSNHAKNA